MRPWGHKLRERRTEEKDLLVGREPDSFRERSFVRKRSVLRSVVCM